jgi:hypothetical protein
MPGRSLARRIARGAAGALPGTLSGALFRRAGRLLRVGGSEAGLVSLVVVCEPVDAPRLADTLASLGAQGHAFREVLVAPVGAEAAAAAGRVLREGRDPRVRRLRASATWQEAANLGARAAAGRFLGFLRGCDPLPPGALARLVDVLAGSGSDLATGLLVQRGQGDEWLDRAQAAAHRRPGVGLDPGDRPELAADLSSATGWSGRRPGVRRGWS